jgi:phage terminase small subunit
MGSGGYRRGAGRKKKAEDKKTRLPNNVSGAILENLTPLEYMLKVMNDPNEDIKRRVKAAIAALPFCHAKATEGKGKKQKQEIRATAAGAGKFAAGKPPLKLVK